MNSIIKSGFTAVTYSPAGGVVPTWWDDNKEPLVYQFAEEVEVEIADHMVEEWGKVATGERPFSDPPILPEIVECDIYDNDEMRVKPSTSQSFTIDLAALKAAMAAIGHGCVTNGEDHP